MELAILDADGTACSPGQKGELALAGPQVASHYWNAPAQTQAAFVPSCLGSGLMYLTGDQCYQDPSGEIVFCGRTDSQVQIEGHRVELAEVENRAREACGSRTAAVVREARPRPLVHLYLEDFEDTALVTRHLAEHLPAYMQPARVVSLKRLPLTPNGKVDRKLLAQPFRFRPAQPSDAAFLAACIIAADASGTELVSYQKIFNLQPSELGQTLEEIAGEELPGQELTWNNFVIAESGGQPAGVCAGWIEAHDSLPSGALKAQIWATVLGRERYLAARENLELVSQLTIDRTPGALQLDSLLVLPTFRGQGLAAKLFDYHICRFRNQSPELGKAQLLVMSDNESAVRAHEKVGFTRVLKKTCDDPRILQLLPGRSRTLMELDLNHWESAHGRA